MGFDLAVVKNGFVVLEHHRIFQLPAGVQNFLHLVLFGAGEIFGVGAGIGQISLLVEPLDDLQRLIHGHFVFFTKNILQFGKGIELSRKKLVLLFLHRAHHRSGFVVFPAKGLCLFLFVFLKTVFGKKLHRFAVGHFFTGKSQIFSRNKIADGHIPLVNRPDNGRNDSAHTQKHAGAQSGVAGKIHAVEPVDIGAGKALVGQEVIVLFIFQVRKGGLHGLGSLVGQPEAL